MSGFVGGDRESISRKAFLKAVEGWQVDPSHLPRGEGATGPRGMAWAANQAERNQDAVLRSEVGFSALFDQAAAKFGTTGEGEIRLRDGQGRPTAAARLFERLSQVALEGQGFWKRSSILHVRIRRLPEHMDANKLRSGGVFVDRAVVEAWFGGPNSSTGQSFFDIARAGVDWAVQNWQGGKVSIKGNTSAWDPCPTWGFAQEKGNIIPGGDEDEKLKLAQNNRTFDAGLRRLVARELVELAGVPVARAIPAELTMEFGGRREYQGVRTLIEERDSMIKRLFPRTRKEAHYVLNWTDQGPANFKLQGGETAEAHVARLSRSYEGKGKKSKGKELVKLVKLVNDPRTRSRDSGAIESWAKDLEKIFDVKTYLRMLGSQVALGNWDGGVETPGNFELHNNSKRGTYLVPIPNDTDNSLGISYHRHGDGRQVNWAKMNIFAPHQTTSAGPDVPLTDAILRVPRFRQYYVDFLETYLDRAFSPERVLGLLGTEDDGASGKGFWPMIKEDAFREGYFDQPPHTKRPYSNDELVRHGRDHQERDDGWRKIYGIKHHVIMAHDHLRGEIRRYRDQDRSHRRQFHDFPVKEAQPRG